MFLLPMPPVYFTAFCFCALKQINKSICCESLKERAKQRVVHLMTTIQAPMIAPGSGDTLIHLNKGRRVIESALPAFGDSNSWPGEGAALKSVFIGN
jgi:hypothetical protein